MIKNHSFFSCSHLILATENESSLLLPVKTAAQWQDSRLKFEYQVQQKGHIWIVMAVVS